MAYVPIHWADNEKHYGPFIRVYNRQAKEATLRLHSGYSEHLGCNLMIRGFGHTLIIQLPQIIKPWREKIAFLDGSGFYEKWHPREYGFNLSDNFFQLHWGKQIDFCSSDDDHKTQSWCCHLPWTQKRLVRQSIYDLAGKHFWTKPKRKRYKKGQTPNILEDRELWREEERQQKACPKAIFLFEDYDHTQITVSTYIKESEYYHGQGWFKWLSLFRRPLIWRYLDLQFAEEVGPEKGSWKGGTMGHSIVMEKGELHEAAFRRYCEQEQSARGNKTFKMKYIKQLVGQELLVYHLRMEARERQREAQRKINEAETQACQVTNP